MMKIDRIADWIFYTVFFGVMFLLGVFLCTDAFAQNVTVQGNMMDTYISSQNDSSNFGALPLMYVGNDTVSGDDTTRGLILFDAIITQVQKDSLLDSIVIAFTVGGDTARGDTLMGSGVIYLHEVDSFWTEGAGTSVTGGDSGRVNWHHRQADSVATTALWDSTGGDFNSTILDSATFSEGTASLIFTGATLDTWAQNVQAGTDTNMGLMLRLGNESDTARVVLVTSDSSGSQPQIRLYWTVTAENRVVYQVRARNASGQQGWVGDSVLVAGSGAGGSGADHGGLGGLGDNDHALYLLKSTFGDSLGDHVPSEDTLNAFFDAPLLPIMFFNVADSITAFDSVYVRGDTVMNAIRIEYLGNETAKQSLRGMLTYRMPVDAVGIASTTLWYSTSATDTADVLVTAELRKRSVTSSIFNHTRKSANTAGNVLDSLYFMVTGSGHAQDSTVALDITMELDKDNHLDLVGWDLIIRYNDD